LFSCFSGAILLIAIFASFNQISFLYNFPHINNGHFNTHVFCKKSPITSKFNSLINTILLKRYIRKIKNPLKTLVLQYFNGNNWDCRGRPGRDHGSVESKPGWEKGSSV
jgi:hypothetical protein